MKIFKTPPIIYLYLIGFKIHSKIVHMFTYDHTISQLIYESFWMSVFSRKAVMAVDNHHYKNSKRYLSKDYNREGLNEWETDMVDRYFAQCENIMVLGSGGGREVYALLKKNFKVEGFECNKSLVAFSQEFFKNEGLHANIEYVAPDHCPDNARIYDGILLGWGVYNHVWGRTVRINMLKEVNSHLQIGSPVLLSYWWAYEKMNLYCQKLTNTNRFFCKLFFRKPIEMGDRLSPFSGHYFSFQDIRDELGEAGFSVIYEAGRPYGHAVAYKISNVVSSGFIAK